MAIFHLSVKPIQRSKGRSATAAAAYRAGVRIVEEITGQIHDYRRRGGVACADIFIPKNAPGWAQDRSSLWNAAEAAEKRKDGTPAREYEVALPSELNEEERRLLVAAFCQEMVDQEGCAVDAAIHTPGKEGDSQNHHAHILRSTRKMEADGFGAKLETEQAGRKRAEDLKVVRERWAEHCNRALQMAGQTARIDHRSNADRGIAALPGIHNGPTISAMERREPRSSRVKRERDEARQAIQQAAQLPQNEVEDIIAHDSPEVAALEAQLEAALIERDQERKRAQLDQERERWKTLTADELAAQIKRLRPPTVSSLVDLELDVRAAARTLNSLNEQRDQAARTKHQAQQDMDNWREQNPKKSWLHDKGIGHSPYLLEREQQQEQARQQQGVLSAQLEAVRQAHQDAQALGRGRIQAEQAPALQSVSELEVLHQDKVRQEREAESQQRAAQEKRQAILEVQQDFAEMARQREMGEKGWDDVGSEWKTAPEALRELLEAFNAGPAHGRAVVLERLTDIGFEYIRDAIQEQRQNSQSNDFDSPK